MKRSFSQAAHFPGSFLSHALHCWSRVVQRSVQQWNIKYDKMNTEYTENQIIKSIWPTLASGPLFTERSGTLSREASKPRDLDLLFHRFEIWQASRQQCSQAACQMSQWYECFKTKSSWGWVTEHIFVTRWITFIFNRSPHSYAVGYHLKSNSPDSKVHGANVGPTWGRQDPGGPQCWPHELCYLGGYIPMILKKKSTDEEYLFITLLGARCDGCISSTSTFLLLFTTHIIFLAYKCFIYKTLPEIN